jgi:3-polyprenyl-4-hydroxybenzoate decarboxylase
MPPFARKIIVGISGSSGPIYGIRLLEALRASGNIEIHLILTEAARQTIALETDWKPNEVLKLGHLRDMIPAAEMGAIILPPVPAFYHHPQNIADIIKHSLGKALDLLSIPHQLFRRWQSP